MLRKDRPTASRNDGGIAKDDCLRLLEESKHIASKPTVGPRRMGRRHFLRGLTGSVALSTLAPSLFPFGPSSFAQSPPVYPFIEVPSSTSGISWKHTAGHSAEKYLPETTGAGCAFLDYDNDGWLDIYFVNSGKCDFFTPAPASPECSLPQQSRWHLQRRYRKSRGSGRRLWAGSGRWRLRRRWLSRHLRDPVRQKHSLSQ